MDIHTSNFFSSYLYNSFKNEKKTTCILFRLSSPLYLSIWAWREKNMRRQTTSRHNIIIHIVIISMDPSRTHTGQETISFFFINLSACPVPCLCPFYINQQLTRSTLALKRRNIFFPPSNYTSFLSRSYTFISIIIFNDLLTTRQSFCFYSIALNSIVKGPHLILKQPFWLVSINRLNTFNTA